MKYKALIVGCGNIAGGYDERKKDNGIYSHAGAYKKAGVEIAAATESNSKRAMEFATFWKVPKMYNDYKKMLSLEKADIVSICVPDELHKEAVLFAAKHSSAKIIFCEKPLSTDSKSAKRMLEACKRTGKILIVDCQRRWEPTHSTAKTMIAEGIIGDVQGITGYFVKGLLHSGSVSIDTTRFLVGEPQKAFSIGDDIMLAFKNGSKAFLISADKHGYGHSAFEIDIMGSKGRIRFSENSNLFEFLVAEEYKKYPGFRMLYLKEKKETEMGTAIFAGINELKNILDGKKQTSVNSAEEFIRNLEIIEEANKNKIC